MLSKDIGIDLGTANVLIYVRGQGIVLDEPSVVAIDAETKKPLKVGTDAKEMLGRTPGKLKAIKPMKDGVIADFEITQLMLEEFIKKVNAKTLFTKPRILICCPSNITQVEKNAIMEAAEKTGAKKVYLEEEPKVAAIGAGLDISKPNGCMVIDIGGGTTDIAVLSLGDIVNSASIKVAGNTFDQEIIKYLKTKYNLLIGEQTAEEIKIRIGTAYKKRKLDSMQVKGRNVITGLPDKVEITSEEVQEALSTVVKGIIHSVKSVLEQTPPELSADIINNGITMTGGGSLLDGLSKTIEKELQIPVTVASNALTCVVEGTGIMLENIHLINN